MSSEMKIFTNFKKLEKIHKHVEITMTSVFENLSDSRKKCNLY
jgi:hypothetical protein